MLDRSTPIRPGLPVPGTVVEFASYKVDWGSIRNPGDVTEGRLSILGDSINHGAWYLNPGYTVHAPGPSADFFRAARYARGQWLRTSRQVLGNPGHRRVTRQAEHQGRLLALMELAGPTPDATSVQHAPDADRPAELPSDRRRPVRAMGLLARQLASSGVMFIHGDLIAPETWDRQAEALLGPAAPARLQIRGRRCDLKAFEAHRDLEPLRRMAREALQVQRDRFPGHAAFVTPHRTVAAPADGVDFYLEARQCHASWCVLLTRAVGKREFRRLRREADPATFTLALHGTLLVGGELYLAGFSPREVPKPRWLRRTPFGSPTVPAVYLGLRP